MKFKLLNQKNTEGIEKGLLFQRRGMAILAFAFPIVFLLSSWGFDHTDFQTSISAYYWTLPFERTYFTGTLCAIGALLFLYRGETVLEDKVLDIAAICAIGVAFFPTDFHKSCELDSNGISAHGVFAVAFFACIYFVAIKMSMSSVPKIPDPVRRRNFKRAYSWCIGIMILTVASSVVTYFLPSGLKVALCEKSLVFWMEALGVWAFSAYWYIKTREFDSSLTWIPFGRAT